MAQFTIKKFKKLKNGNHAIGYKEVLKFNRNDLNRYKEKFNELKENNVIIEGEFEDNIWVLFGRERKANFYFNYDFNKNLNLALKMFLLLKIYDESVDPRTMVLEFSGINFILEKSNCLDLNNIENLKNVLEKHKHHYLINSIVNSVYKFICFYDSVNLKPIADIIVRYNKRTGYGNRNLPNFTSVIYFDDILNDFIENALKTDKHKYFPIIIWWSITKCIPMRPIELSELETNCVECINDIFILKVPNLAKGDKNKKLNKEKYRNVQITKELYDLIEDFISINDPKRLQKYLFNYDIYANYYGSNTSNELFEKYRDNLGGTNRFYDLLNNFYKEIIENKYGYKTVSIYDDSLVEQAEFNIERIRPGDTRHFAICNLYLQGFNPLTIARLAGHDTLNIQLGYANHLNTFAESHVKVLTDKIIKTRRFANKFNDNSRIKDLYKKSLFSNYKDHTSIKKVENGYCLDKNFPQNCIVSLCSEGCDFYVLDFDQNKDMSEFWNQSEKYKNEIEKQINIIKKIIKSTQLIKSSTNRNRCFDIREQNNIGVASKKLQHAITQKAIVDSYIFEMRKVESYE